MGATIRLSDGRALGFCEFGAPRGVPVLYFHGAAGSPIDRCDLAGALLARWGVRWIVAHRPGFGASTRAPGRRLADWGRDAEELADALGLERLRIAGVSAGGPYALAAAARLGPRVEAVAAVSSLGPPRRALHIGPRGRRALELGAERAIRACRARPDLVMRLGGRSSLAVPGAADALRAALEASAARGAGPVVDDLLPLLADWGLDLAAIGTDVMLWHGAHDRLVPLPQAVRLAAKLPNARLVACEREGHFFFRRRVGEIVGALLETPSFAAPQRSRLGWPARSSSSSSP